MKLRPTGTTLTQLEANPAKAFFVDMLTRDLSLEDAILDLLDNCVDGALRSKNKAKKTAGKLFDGFRADLTINPASFSIRDNCGGIPEDKLLYAFMHGRPVGASNEGLPTVGTYGIGMKRAIYKIGTEARVVTQSGKLVCEVPFTKKWMSTDGWKLPLNGTTEKFERDGTLVEVSTLRKEVQKIFSVGREDFLKRLRNMIGEHYSYLIGQGFIVTVNNKPVEGKPIDILFEKNAKSGAKALRPFFWERERDGVHVFLAVGFYRPPPKKSEADEDEDEAENWKSEQSGWTVLCNHRVVAYCDKTFLTGWGDRPIPRFHTQFNAIRGIVVFESSDASKLPTTTTKRGLDVGDPFYAEVKNVMKDGLRIFIDSTNKWKGESDASRTMLNAISLKTLGLDELRVEAKSLVRQSKASSGGFVSKPLLPEPDNVDSLVWIRFAKDKDDVCAVGDYLFGDTSARPADIGETCFDQILGKARKG